MSDIQPENFITVVSVGSKLGQNAEEANGQSNIPGYVTVLTIGDAENNNKLVKDVTEEVIVYRLPGERLGFGLKFEGGTKANEFVERLFIQSCAADSPASHVKSSWGKLTEGDEVLEIDSIPVKTMTRVDCVRCLKDSNVAIKLLVRHVFEDQTNKSKEELPSVISTEEKRTPPPPPPVPPRKIPRKMIKNPNGSIPVMTNGTKETQENTSRQNESSKSKKLQSPRSSGRYYSPDVPRRDRRFSDGSLGPPDAEVYVDLFLQESTQSLSESDDTGSTISTVIDRFGSFPTTTTSSFSGSLPSTPTAVQRHLDISNISIYDDEDVSLVNKNNEKPSLLNREENNNIISDEGSPLCFQDAPLSYGNESTKYLVPEEIEETPVMTEESKQCHKKPPVPPRAKDLTVSIEKNKDAKKSENLPRLVDFVPKTNGVKETSENPTEIIKLFLENERHRNNCDDFDANDNDNIDNIDAYSNNIDLYTSKWNMSSQLATIGEVEEELSGSDFNSFNRPSVKSTPVVIVENADVSTENDTRHNEINRDQSGPDGIMATPPSDSRQPPDGDEFPDFIENKEVILINHPAKNYFKPAPPEKLPTMEDLKSANLNLSQVSSSNDLNKTMFESADDIPEPTPLHTRSQSLIDMSSLSKEKNARWNQIVEQRRKGLSKLKGLVIPEATENDVAPQPINIPEIKSINTAILFSVPKVDNSYSVPQGFQPPKTKPPIVIPPLVSNTTNNLPKYSPAFKRKSLQVYPTIISKNDSSENVAATEITKNCDKSSSPKSSKISDDDLNPPKSLESISSPTRSDCSFDYVSSTKKYSKENNESFPKTHANRLEDESDNDSAVSSSQSSYNSRFSPPPSPTRSCEMNHFRGKDEDDKNAQRLLKASSVEAINRKNILASAKCRSGKDLKIGSPVIRRKDETKEPESATTNNQTTPEKDNVDEVKMESRVWEKVDAVVSVNEDVKINSDTPIQNTVQKEEVILKSTVKIPENAPSPVKPLPRSISASSCLPTTPSRLTKTPPEPSLRQSTPNNVNNRPYTSVLNRKSTPINVKALTQNFENFGSSPPPLPQKVPTFKSQVITKNVKAEIRKTESKILNNGDSPIKQVPKPEVKPKPREPVTPLKLEKREEDLTDTNRLSFSTDTVVLRLDTLGGSLGITLAGGVDESKEISVHRIRYGSIAYHDGRLKRGDRVISVNGKATKGLSHAEAGDLLKEPVMEFTFEIQEAIEMVPSTPSSLSSRRSSSMSILTEIKPPVVESTPREVTNVIAFVKDGSGLGFSIEGGKESPQGDVPLVVKKIFTGGAADKHGELKIGDEILKMNDISFLNLTRIEAWNSMKKIPDGTVNIHVYRKC